MNKTETQIVPYLNFDGNCLEAMQFYTEVFNGKLEVMPFSEGPMEIPESEKDRVMHSHLVFGKNQLMASDTMPGQPFSQGNTYSISISEPDLEKAKFFFEKLSEGGHVIMPFEKAFWGAHFGMFSDKYGVNWMVNTES
ncbi:VOC family protein [Prolixibacteraceae bacterium JC049]|nr:VOC family protein [Prolixibacteraceae bacterium JC049]